MYSFGKKEIGKHLFKSVINASERDGIEYFEDLKAKRDCLNMMKELGLL